MNRIASLLSILGASAVMAARLVAHDMWIEPSSFKPASGAIVALRLRVGQEMLGDPLPYSAALVNEFVVEDATGRRAVVAREGGDPAGLLRSTAAGPAVVLYASKPSRVEQTAEKFDKYLTDEGLDAAAAERAKRNESKLPGREEFSRCAKTLIAIGEDKPVQDRRMGCVLELVAEASPATGATLPLRLTYNDKPLAGATVVLRNKTNPALTQRGRTDRAGKVVLPIGPGAGLWMVKAVYMVRAAAGLDVEWSSFWASISFERPGSASSQSGGH